MGHLDHLADINKMDIHRGSIGVESITIGVIVGMKVAMARYILEQKRGCRGWHPLGVELCRFFITQLSSRSCSCAHRLHSGAVLPSWLRRRVPEPRWDIPS